MHKSLSRHKTPHQSSVASSDPVHLEMMNGGILALCFLTLASQGSWCVGDISTRDDRLRLQEFHGKKKLEIQSNRKVGHGQSLAKHEVSAVEIKHVRRVAIGHKGGSSAGGGGGGAVMRPHNKKNGAAVLPVPVLALSLACGLVLSVFSF